MFCEKCGMELQNSDEYCSNCGFGVTQKDESVQEAVHSFEETEVLTKKARKSKLPLLIVVLLALILIGVGGNFAYSHFSLPSRIAEQLDLANQHMEEMDYEEAIAIYEGVLEIDPANPDAFLGIVEVYIRTSEFDKALEYAERGYEVTGDERLKEKADMFKSGRIFDSRGCLRKEFGFDSSNQLLWYFLFSYDNWEMVSATSYTADGQQTGHVDIERNENGYEVVGYYGHYLHFNSDIMVVDPVVYEYEGDKLVRQKEYADGKVSITEEFEYDENGRRILIKVYRDDEKEPYSISKPIYDESGNEIGVESYDREGNMERFIW